MANGQSRASRRRAYVVKVNAKVHKALARVTPQDRERIIAAIDALAKDPLPAGCEPVKLASKGTYRIRVGDYRVIYEVLSNDQVLLVSRVARRGEGTYKSLR